MRIIGGQFKGRRFSPPAEHWPTRPTTDLAREALFNIIGNHFFFEELRVLDLFGGTGSNAYEFISRGCVHATYVEQFGPAVKFVEQTAAALGVQDRLRIVRGDAFRFLDRPSGPYDVVFADPPYDLPTVDILPARVLEGGFVQPQGWFILEHGHQHDFAQHPHFLELRRYGRTYFSIFLGSPTH